MVLRGRAGTEQRGSPEHWGWASCLVPWPSVSRVWFWEKGTLDFCVFFLKAACEFTILSLYKE